MEDNKDTGVFDLELNKRGVLYLLEFNNFTVSFRIKLCRVYAINGDKIECVIINSPYNCEDESVTISHNDIAEVLIANNLFNRAAAVTRVTKGIYEANPNKDEFIPLLYYLNKDRAYAEMADRVNKINFGKGITAMTHDLNYSELNNWLVGLTSCIKHITKYDKKSNLDDVKKYVHEYIDKSLDNPDKNLWGE